jgi:hypothetical protein
LWMKKFNYHFVCFFFYFFLTFFFTNPPARAANPVATTDGKGQNSIQEGINQASTPAGSSQP